MCVGECMCVYVWVCVCMDIILDKFDTKLLWWACAEDETH